MRPQPIHRVIRSRRDDRFVAGHPAPPKRSESGYVISVQSETDSVTVDVLDEQLTGVVFLGEAPPVGAICEVEARGDLLVVPMWYPGPPPPLPEIVVDVTMSRARLVRSGSSPTDVFLDIPEDGPVSFENNGTTHTSTFLYPVQYEGHDADGTDFIPATPDGYVLSDLRPFLKAHTEDASQDTITEDTSDWGYLPLPTLSPFLLVGSPRKCFDTFPAGTDPAEVIVCGAAIAGEEYQSPLWIEYESAPTACRIVLSEYGWRHTYTPTGA